MSDVLIPEALSMARRDGTSVANHVSPRLTTVHQPRVQIGGAIECRVNPIVPKPWRAATGPECGQTVVDGCGSLL